MSDLADIRRANLVVLIGKAPNASQFARQAGLASAQLRQIVNISPTAGKPTRMCGEKLARKIESRLGLEAGWLDARRDPSAGDALVSTGPRERSCVDEASIESGDVIRLTGLTPLQRATIDAFLKICLGPGLSDRECVAMLDGWKDKLQ